MAANDDGLGPGGHQTRNIADDDGLTENDSAKNVADGAIRRLPHLLQPEFIYAGFIRSDRGALNTDAVLLDGMCGIDGDLIIGCIAVLHTKVVVLQVDVEVLHDEFILDELPNDAGHFIAVEFNNRIGDLNLAHDAPHRSLTSACLALTASYASPSRARSSSVNAVSTTSTMPPAPMRASTPR